MCTIVRSEFSRVVRRFTHIAFVVLLSGAADAATFVVDRFDDPFPVNTCITAVANDCSVREAVIAANNSAGTDAIQIPAGLFTLTRAGSLEDTSIIGDLDVLDTVFISGAGMDLTMIDGGGATGIQDTIFHILSGPGTEIQNLTLQGSEADGANASPGGVRVTSNLKLRNVRIRNNDSTFAGACVVDSLAVLQIVDSEIIANTGFGGGCFNEGDLTIERSLIANNVGTEGWGGVENDAGTLTITNSVFSNNTVGNMSAGFNSGGAINHRNGISRISDSVLSGNQAINGNGGAIFIQAGNLFLDRATLENNTAVAGGAIYQNLENSPFPLGGISEISDTVFSANLAIDSGGALSLDNGLMSLEFATIESNSAAAGGAFAIGVGGVLRISRSTISNNSAIGGAAGIAFGGVARLIDTTVSGNTSGNLQGVLTSTLPEGDLRLKHVTFFDNDGMGQDIKSDVSVALFNSIIQGTCTGNISTFGGNIESPSDTCGLSPTLDSANVPDLGLKPLGYYGGSTQTHLPLPDSVVLDNPLCMELLGGFQPDQRGMTRPVQSTNLGVRCDPGAVEYQGSRTLDVALNGDGAVISVPVGIDCGTTCSAVFELGSVVQLTATPNPGSVHIGWNLPACSGPSCTISMSQYRSVIAYFESTFTLDTAIQGSGTGTLTSQPAGINCPSQCSGQFLANSNVSLTATPAPGSSIVGWSEAACSVNSICPISMSQNQSVTVFLSDPAVLFKSSFEN